MDESHAGGNEHECTAAFCCWQPCGPSHEPPLLALMAAYSGGLGPRLWSYPLSEPNLNAIVVIGTS